MYHFPTRLCGLNALTVASYPTSSAELSTFLGTLTHSFSSMVQLSHSLRSSLPNSAKHRVAHDCSPLHLPRQLTPLMPRGLENRFLVWMPHLLMKHPTSLCSILFSLAYSAKPS